MRWQDIRALYQHHVRSNLYGVPLGVYYNFTIEIIPGDILKFTNAIENIEELGTHLQNMTFPHLFADARTNYQQGNVVSFGKIGISDRGIHQGQKILAWPNIRDVVIVESRLRVRKQGSWLAWASVAIAKIPNVHILLLLIEQQMKATSKDSQEP